jgi:hypothetical protein
MGQFAGSLCIVSFAREVKAEFKRIIVAEKYKDKEKVNTGE